MAPSLDVSDTIVAVASAPGGAARGILRISGPRSLSCVHDSCDGDTRLASSPAPRAVDLSLRLVGGLGRLPCRALVWPTSRSYTRQPSVELHTIGSPPLLDAALRTICAAGARLAAPGEFTLRAFLAGRIDLPQAEAVLGVIDADSRGELDLALNQLAGGLSQPLRSLREELLQLLAQIEAGLDFVEEDIEFISSEQIESQLSTVAEQVEELRSQMASRGRRREEARIVLRGAPNVGKSSLLNALVNRHDWSQALVSPESGTTRDYVTANLRVGDHEYLLVDTAGVEHGDPSESLSDAAQQVAAAQSEQADLQLFCLDGGRPLNDWERAELNRPPSVPRLVVYTKADLSSHSEARFGDRFDGVVTSSREGTGLAELKAAIASRLEARDGGERAVVAGTAARCRDCVERAATAIDEARRTNCDRLGDELTAGELRLALDELGRVVGAVYTDDVLDQIFSRFCIGK